MRKFAIKDSILFFIFIFLAFYATRLREEEQKNMQKYWSEYREQGM